MDELLEMFFTRKLAIRVHVSDMDSIYALQQLLDAAYGSPVEFPYSGTIPNFMQKRHTRSGMLCAYIVFNTVPGHNEGKLSFNDTWEWYMTRVFK